MMLFGAWLLNGRGRIVSAPVFLCFAYPVLPLSTILREAQDLPAFCNFRDRFCRYDRTAALRKLLNFAQFRRCSPVR
jgi:hypothetical protein